MLASNCYFVLNRMLESQANVVGCMFIGDQNKTLCSMELYLASSCNIRFHFCAARDDGLIGK